MREIEHDFVVYVVVFYFGATSPDFIFANLFFEEGKKEEGKERGREEEGRLRKWKLKNMALFFHATWNKHSKS